LWHHSQFEADYLEKNIATYMKRWIAAVTAGAEPKHKARKKQAATGGAGRPARPRKGKDPDKETDKEKAAEKRRKKKEEAGGGKVTKEQQEKLRERLKDVRRRHHRGGGNAPEIEHVRSDLEEYGSSGEEEESMSYAPTVGSKTKEKRRYRDDKDPGKNQGTLVPYKDSKGHELEGPTGWQSAGIKLCAEKFRVEEEEEPPGSKGARRCPPGDFRPERQERQEEEQEEEEDAGEWRVFGDRPGGPNQEEVSTAPGSILALLTEHVRNQMEQDAQADLPAGHHQVTSGVKTVTYFHQHIKVPYAQSQREKCTTWAAPRTY
jgi:hypothetical protein